MRLSDFKLFLEQSLSNAMVDKYAKYADLGKDSKAVTDKADAKTLATPPTKEGVLFRSEDNKAWAKEFASLIGTTVYVFEDEKKAKSTVTLDLKVFAVLNKTIDDATKENQFSLQSGNQGTFHFAAESDDDKTEWTKWLGRGIIKART